MNNEHCNALDTQLGLLSLILKSLIKSLMQNSDIGAYIVEIRLTSVGLFVHEL